MTVVPMIDPNGFRCTDGELPHGCDAVWAKQLFGGAKVHFWRHTSAGYYSECGSAFAPLTLHNGQNALFGGGTYPKCKRCMEWLRKNGTQR